MSLDTSNSSQREENRRALLRLYSLYTIQYAAFVLILAVAFVGELVLIGSSAFPQFVIYPLILVTVIPAIISFYYMIRWWRIQHYTLTLPLDAVQGDSLAALHLTYESYADERSSRFIVEGMNKLDGRRVALVILFVFLLSLPLSYLAVTSSGFAILVLAVAVSFAAGALVVLLIPPLTSRVNRGVIVGAEAEPVAKSGSQSDPAVGMTDEILNVLSAQAEQLRRTANENAQTATDRIQAPARVSIGDLPDRILAEIHSLETLKGSMLPRQTENLTRVVSSLTSTVISLGLPVEAARIYSAYRVIIPR